MKTKCIYIWVTLLINICLSCSVSVPTTEEEYDILPPVYPDYMDVTIPPNIAPLRFRLNTSSEEAIAVLSCHSFQIIEKAKNGNFMFRIKDWKKLMEHAKGHDIEVKLYEKKDNKWFLYPSFRIHVANEEIDNYLAYRLIPPGYELWYEMGIYQRDITSWDEKAILTNKKTGNNCINCHSFCMQNPTQMLFHMRESHAGTYIWNNGELQRISGKIAENIPSLVYPYWHPSGKYIAFSTNTTTQMFHMGDKNRIEVYDVSSDVLVYNLKKNEIITDSLIFSSNAFETFPIFSPDGKALYFCSSKAQQMPEDYKKVKYDICRINFHPETGRFGQKVDTIVYASKDNQSVVFPRISPDGRFLVFCKSAYGNFTIWHKDADLWMMDLQSGDLRSMVEINSKESESYHSWSSNGRWMVFASRQQNGLYTHPYITYIKPNGKATKAFVLPQKHPEYYLNSMYSYNIPEFIISEVNFNSNSIITK